MEQVKKDLSKIDWKRRGTDNVTREERKARRELKKATDIVIKGSDKSGNTVPISQTMYEG